MKRRSLLVPVLLGGLALATAGCGGQQFPQSAAPSTATSTRSPRARLLASLQRVTADKTARIAMSMSVDALGESTTIAGSGVIDTADNQMSLSLTGNADGGEVSLDIRLVGGKLYVKTDGDWLSVPVSSTEADTPDPTSYLAYLQGVSADVSEVGPAVVRGADTTEYSASIDFDRALAQAHNSGERAVFAHALDMFGAAKLPAKVWIDADGRLRKLQLEMDLSSALSRAGQSVEGAPKVVVSLELYDFGVPVDIQVPAGAIDQATAAQNRAAESDLRNALTAEKTVFTDDIKYTTDLTTLREIESSLDWGGKLKVVVGDAADRPGFIVCLSEQSKSGAVLSIADVADGPNAGTYFGHRACPATVDSTTVAALGRSW